MRFIPSFSTGLAFPTGQWRSYMPTPFTYRGWRIVYSSSTIFLDMDALWRAGFQNLELRCN